MHRIGICKHSDRLANDSKYNIVWIFKLAFFFQKLFVELTCYTKFTLSHFCLHFEKTAMKGFSPKLSLEIPTLKALGRKSFDAVLLIFFRACAYTWPRSYARDNIEKMLSARARARPPFIKRIWDKRACPRTLSEAPLVVQFLDPNPNSYRYVYRIFVHTLSTNVKCTSSPTLSANYEFLCLNSLGDLANHVSFKNRWTGLMIGTKPNMGSRFS